MKSKRIFSLAAILLLAMFVAGGLWAQQLPGSNTAIGSPGQGAWTSAQSTATQGRYRSAADDFIRPDSYTSAKINNWFAMSAFVTDGNRVHLGYAKKLENLYIGAYYGGTFWTNFFDNNYKEGLVTFGGINNAKVPVYASTPAFKANAPDNRVAILIGAADMGFRFSFRTTHDHIDLTDFQVNNGIDPVVDYKSFKSAKGLISPQIAWSMSKNMTPKGIKPYATFDLDFNRDYERSVIVGDPAQMGENVAKSANYIQPIFGMGLGGYTLYNQNGFSFSADLDNIFTLRTYNDNKMRAGAGTAGDPYRALSIKGTWDGTTAYKYSRWVQDVITPSVSGSWSEGSLALKFKLNMDMTLGGYRKTEMEAYGNGLLNDGDDDKVFFAGFNPNLRLAMQWKCVPDRLTLNAGGRINMGNLTRTTSKTENYASGMKVYNGTKVTVDKGATTNVLGIGATFTPTGNITFEATCGATASSTAVGGGNGNRIRVFDGGNDGFFTFANILASLKF